MTAGAARSNHEASLLALGLLFASVAESGDPIAGLRAAATART